MEPTFGSTNTIFAMSVSRWQRLAPDLQRMLLDAGAKTEADSQKVGDEIVAEERAELAKHGVRVTQLPPDKAALVREAWDKTQWELAEKCCGQAAQELRDVVRRAGLTK
jgi:TRAP-type C4-dicarboxylate transport system substrate-binding protein